MHKSIAGAMMSAVAVGVVGAGALLVPAAADSGDGRLGFGVRDQSNEHQRVNC